MKCENPEMLYVYTNKKKPIIILTVIGLFTAPLS